MVDFFQHLIHEFELPLKNPVLVFSLILFIILLSPILLRKLNIPGIIGLIISGVLIGPHGFNILEKNSAVELFSTIGLLYIMFIAGLELDMNDFKINRNKSFVFGFFTFAIPLTVGFPICYYLLGYDFNASFLTSSMFATHTLVAYPIVSKLGISKNQAVAITVGGTILTDTAVLIIFAVIMGANQGNLTQEFWWRLGISLAIFSAIMFIIIPRIAKWFFKKLESEKHSHYIFVLAVVFFAAFLAQVAGVEAIIGAFVAGLALNKLIPTSSALMNRIEFIGNSLFIPFFLISVGMVVNVKVLLNGPTALIVAGVLTVVALLGKWLAAYATQLTFKYNAIQRQLIFGLSSSHAAATLAIILVGYEAGIIDENILNGTIILILITCIVASFATEKAAKRLLISSDSDQLDQNTSKLSRNEHILMPIANMVNVDKMLDFAILIKDKQSTNPISILSVVMNNEEAEMNILKAKNKLESFVKQASAYEKNVNIIATIDHNTASGIARTSREIMSDIIIIGWPNRANVIDKIIGEKVEGILNTVEKTILVCHFNKPLVSHKRIVIAAPPLSEHEFGFHLWFSKVLKLAQELRIPIKFFGDQNTEKFVQKQLEINRINITVDFETFTDWEDFLIISRRIEENDLFILSSSRKGSVSYQSALEHVPGKIEKHFEHLNRIVIYPYQNSKESIIDGYKDISSEPITKGLEKIQKLGKGIGEIFKKDQQEDL